MERIDQSVAKRVTLKAFLASDHISPATGKTIAVVISKNGAAFGNPNAGATNATAIGSGWYYVDLDTTDTGTAGPLIVRGTEADIDDVEIAFSVEPALPTAVESADALLTRDWTSVTGEASRSVLNSLRFVRNAWSVSGSPPTVTVTKEDDTTPAWSKEVTPAPGADPISGVGADE